MAKSLDHVLQSDGTYKWEEVELVIQLHQLNLKFPLTPAPKETKKKVSKRKLLAHYLTNSWQSKKK